MQKFEDKLYQKKVWVLAALVLITIISSFRYFGDLESFLITLGGHIIFGQAIYCYLSGRMIVVGAAISANASLVERRAAGIFALTGFVFMWFYAA